MPWLHFCSRCMPWLLFCSRYMPWLLPFCSRCMPWLHFCSRCMPWLLFCSRCMPWLPFCSRRMPWLHFCSRCMSWLPFCSRCMPWLLFALDVNRSTFLDFFLDISGNHGGKKIQEVSEFEETSSWLRCTSTIIFDRVNAGLQEGKGLIRHTVYTTPTVPHTQ